MAYEIRRMRKTTAPPYSLSKELPGPAGNRTAAVHSSWKSVHFTRRLRQHQWIKTRVRDMAQCSSGGNNDGGGVGVGMTTPAFACAFRPDKLSTHTRAIRVERSVLPPGFWCGTTVDDGCGWPGGGWGHNGSLMFVILVDCGRMG